MDTYGRNLSTHFPLLPFHFLFISTFGKCSNVSVCVDGVFNDAFNTLHFITMNGMNGNEKELKWMWKKMFVASRDFKFMSSVFNEMISCYTSRTVIYINNLIEEKCVEIREVGIINFLVDISKGLALLYN